MAPPFSNQNLYPLFKPTNPQQTQLLDSGSSKESSSNGSHGRAAATGLPATETGFCGFGGACRNDVVEAGDGEGRRGDSGS